ncbi:MAG: glycoside hydrolase family 15 protein [Acidimicrobiales bacterium]
MSPVIGSDPAGPLRLRGGYPRLEDLGLIGDGMTAALVARDGSVLWLCAPRFDSEPLFAGLLDARRGGSFSIRVEGLVGSRQRYEPDSGVLVTELQAATGKVRITDFLALRSGADLSEDAPAGRGELVRSVTVLDGEVRLELRVEPFGGATARDRGDRLEVLANRQPGLRLELRSNRRLDGLSSVYDLRSGQRFELVLSWGQQRRHRVQTVEMLAETTLAAWRRWMRTFDYEGPQPDMVRRAAITLKLCDHWAYGSMVAAPTSSLPAPVGGQRNWDYRYTWVRDAAFTVWALRRVGFEGEADAFLGWVLDAFESSNGPRIMYDLAGGPVAGEREDAELEGYRQSSPVRWGNGATDQRQHDVFGEVLDCAHQWVSGGGRLDDDLWSRLAALAEAARTAWRQPDQGIWEVRNEGRVFTYSAAMCQVALDRAARLSERLGLPGAATSWRASAEDVRRAVLEEAWDERWPALSGYLGGGALDASVLALPLRRVVPADHPRMVATAAAISERLSAGDGLLYRYLPEEMPDGVPGHEGAFLLCSFWLVDNLAHQGRLDEAHALFESLCARANPLGLLPEQIDPTSGEFIGNFPQAFSHIGVISSGVNLARLRGR